MLTLLLVVSYIANYLATTLPTQMSDQEFDHLLQVEDQFEQLRAAVLAEAEHPRVPIAIPSPITLGSASVPPFGTPSLGNLAPEPFGAGLGVNYTLESVTPTTPSWGNFSNCLPGGSGHCAGNGNVNYANLSGNNTTLSVTVTGGSNSLVYNINGNNDTLTVSWSGKDEGVVAIVVNGSYDSVKLSKSGSDTTVPTMSFYFFGIHDTYSMSLSGSHASGGGMFINVEFIGSLAVQCPYGNYSATDKVGTLGSGGSNLNLSVTWWNAVGYVTAPHIVAYPGSSLPSESITWKNVTGLTACPFLQLHTSSFLSSYVGGLAATLQNRYLPTDDIGYEDGAVVVGTPGVNAFMLAPPDFSFNETRSGMNASLFFVGLTGTVGSESGVTTALVTTHLVAETTTMFGSGANSVYLATPFYLNITTEFPQAWSTYFAQFQQAFPYGVSCQVIGTPLPTGTTCLQPPPGTSVRIVAPLYAQSLIVTTVLVSISLD